MGEIYVFVPGQSGRNLEALRKLGLDCYHDKKLALHVVDWLDCGPSGTPGVAFYWASQGIPRMPPRFSDASQMWHPVSRDGDLSEGRAWIGWQSDSPPTEADLRRPNTHSGELLKLADGAEWLIPIANALPRTLRLSNEGNLVGVVTGEYAKFYDEAMRADMMFSPVEGGRMEADYARAFDFAVKALEINYRIGRDLASLMGVLGTEELFPVARIAASFDFFRKLAREHLGGEGA